MERYPTLSGLCLNVGCIPSKALLHAAKVITDAEDMAHHGVSFGAPAIDLDGIRKFKDGVVSRLTKGLAGLAKARKVTVVEGAAQLDSPHTLSVETKDGPKVVSFDHCIITAGSQSARIPGLPYDDPRLMDSTGALELKDLTAASVYADTADSQARHALALGRLEEAARLEQQVYDIAQGVLAKSTSRLCY